MYESLKLSLLMWEFGLKHASLYFILLYFHPILWCLTKVLHGQESVERLIVKYIETRCFGTCVSAHELKDDTHTHAETHACTQDEQFISDTSLELSECSPSGFVVQSSLSHSSYTLTSIECFFFFFFFCREWRQWCRVKKCDMDSERNVNGCDCARTCACVRTSVCVYIGVQPF